MAAVGAYTVSVGGGGSVGPTPATLNVTTLTTNTAANAALAVIAATPTANATVIGGSTPAAYGATSTTIGVTATAVVVNNTSPVILTNSVGTANQIIYAGIGTLNMTDVGTSDTIVSGGGIGTITFSATSLNSQFRGDGTNTISVIGSSVASLAGVTSIYGTAASADTINGVAPGAAGIYYQAAIGSTALIDPGAHNATILGAAGATEVVSVFGGNAFTGTLSVSGGSGYFQGGSAGNNIMESSATAAGTSLIGGGAGDVLTSQGYGDVLKAGSGAATLQGANAIGGAFFYAGATGADVMYASTIAGGGLALGDTFYASTSTSTGTVSGALYHGYSFEGSFVDLHTNAAGANIGATGNSSVVGSGIGAAQFMTVGDFVSGVDQLVLTLSSGETYSIQSSTAGGVASSVVTVSNGTQFTFLGTTINTHDILTR